jgi:hypothetical protein
MVVDEMTGREGAGQPGKEDVDDGLGPLCRVLWKIAERQARERAKAGQAAAAQPPATARGVVYVEVPCDELIQRLARAYRVISQAGVRDGLVERAPVGSESVTRSPAV